MISPISLNYLRKKNIRAKGDRSEKKGEYKWSNVDISKKKCISEEQLSRKKSRYQRKKKRKEKKKKWISEKKKSSIFEKRS